MDQDMRESTAGGFDAGHETASGTDASGGQACFESLLLDNIHDAIFATDPDGMVTYWNDMAEALFGWPPAETLGRSAYWLFAPLIGRKACLDASRKLATCGSFAGEIDFSRPGGHRIHADVHARLFREPAGQPAGQTDAQPCGAVFSIRDISRYWNIEQALRQADRDKNQVLNIISHELRNPLATVMMGLALLKKIPSGDQRALRTVDMLERQTAQMSRLVDDLLDTTRIGANKVKLRKARLEVNDLVGRIMADHHPLFEAQGVALSLDRWPEPLIVAADAERLTQMVGNLLQNALKFTGRGGRVAVRTSCQEDPPAIRITVSDTGIGIAPERLCDIFQPFAQLDTALARTHGGLGLGLSIVRGLAELHNGQVEAHSAGLGHGARFTITLPVRQDQHPDAPGAEEQTDCTDNDMEEDNNHELDRHAADAQAAHKQECERR